MWKVTENMGVIRECRATAGSSGTEVVGEAGARCRCRTKVWPIATFQTVALFGCMECFHVKEAIS